MTSPRTPQTPPIIANAPMRTNWCTAESPPMTTPSPISQWPPSVAQLANITSLPTWQSCPTWLLAMKKPRSPTVVTPPPSSVPGFMVTLSRMSQSAPTTSRVGPPR